MKKRLLSLLLTASMILGMLPVTVFATDGDNAALSEGGEHWYNAEATELVIDTVEELQEFALITQGNHETIAKDNFKGKTVMLGASIDLTGTYWYNRNAEGNVTADYRIGDFAGTFDGKDNTISNISLKNAYASDSSVALRLFGNVTGSIKNLTFDGIKAEAVGNASAYLINYVQTSNASRPEDANLYNVHVEDFDVYIDNDECAADTNSQVAGLVRWAGKGLVAEDCSVTNLNATVTGKAIVGGFSAYVAQTSEFYNCDVGNFTLKLGSVYAGVGGFAGQVQSSSYVQRVFDNCDVTDLDMTIDYLDTMAGGFLGNLGGMVNCDDCDVVGEITITSDVENAHAGGFIGDLGWQGDWSNDKKGHTFDNCTADVDITAVNSDVGGFVGMSAIVDDTALDQDEAFSAVFTDCSASGDVYTESGAAGGFVGSGDRGEYEGCKATGSVQGDIAGGFWGEIFSMPAAPANGNTGKGEAFTGVVLEGVTASEAVTGTTSSAGLIGYLDNKDSDAGYTTPVILKDNSSDEINKSEDAEDIEIIKLVAAIGSEKYPSLQAAIEDAEAGAEIVLLAAVTEDITIDKKLTIDGDQNTYTGKMTVKADATITNVNFDGNGYNGYAVETRGANYLTIEDCTAKNYGYGFVQLASGTALTTVRNVAVSNCNYGVKVDYSNEVILDNVDLECTVAGLLNSNYGEKTITIEDSDISILGTWTRNDTIKTNIVFMGTNTVDEFVIDAAIDVFKLAKGSTLTAPEGQTITTDAEGYKVQYEDGKYSLALVDPGVELTVEGKDTVYCYDLYEALDIIQPHDTATIKILKDMTITADQRMFTNYSVVINAEYITMDLNGKTITFDYVGSSATVYAAIAIYNQGTLKVIDSSENQTGTLYNKTKIQDTDGPRIIWVTSAGNATLEGGNFISEQGDTMFYCSNSNMKVPTTLYIKGGYYKHTIPTSGETYRYFNIQDGGGQEIIEVSGGTFKHDPTDFEMQFPEGYKPEQNTDGTWGVVPETAPVYVNIYRNGDVNNVYTSVALGEMPIGSVLDIGTLTVKDYYTSVNGFEYEGWFNDGGWNSYKAGNNPSGLSQITINGWTNLYVMVTDYENVIIKAVVNGDKDNAETIVSGKALKGSDLNEYLNTIEIAERTGYKLSKWFNWDWYGNKVADNAIVNGWTNVYVTYDAVTYTIKYNAGEGIYSGSLPNSKPEWLMMKNQYTYDQPVALYDGAGFVRDGWALIGWTTNQNSIEVEYELGAIVNKNFTSTQNGTVQFYAVWTPNQTNFDPSSVDVTYKVEHYQEELDGTYALVETEFPLFAKIGSTVTAVSKTYEGFTLNEVDDTVVEMPRDPAEGEEFPIVSTVKAYYSRNEYIITVDAEEGGTVTVQDAAVFGETVHYSIVPSTGYKVVKAELQYQGKNGPVATKLSGEGNLRMPAADVTVVVEFEQIIYNITVDTEEGGTVTIQDTAVFGEMVPYSIVPDAGYKVAKAELQYQGKNGPVATKLSGEGNLRMPAADVTVVVEFEQIIYNITVDTEEGGTVTIQDTAVFGEMVPYSIVPDAGYKVAKAELQYQGKNGPVTTKLSGEGNLRMPAADVTVVVEFEKIIYNITIASCEHGTIISKVNGKEAETATIDDVIEFEVTPNAGYKLQKLNYYFTLDVGGGAGGGLAAGDSLPMRAGNVRISAVFEPIIYTITFNSGEHGAFVDGSKQIIVETAYASEFPTVPELKAEKHFEFVDWTPVLPATVPLNGGTYTAQWTQVSTDPSVVTPATATYFVDHYIENENGEYELKETEHFTAELGKSVIADSTKYVDIYHRVDEAQSTLCGVVTFDTDASDPMATLLTLSVYYEKYAVDISEVEAKAAAYRVQYYTENLDGTYTLTDTQYKTGVIGEYADATYMIPQNYKLGDTAVLTGIVYFPDAEGAASIDEVDMLTLKVYYDLNEYTITFDSNGGKAVDSQTVKYGGMIEEPAKPTRSGYNFDGWYLNGKLFDFDTFVTSDITLIAKWGREPITPVGPVTYKIKVDTDGVESSHKTARKGEIITLTIEDGLEIVVLDKNDNEIELTYKAGKYTFKMPGCSVTVKAAEKVVINPFVDVADDAYYTEAVMWALEEGITTGTGTVTFSPNAVCTRAQVVTFLWRAAGEPAPKSTDMIFTDVAEGAYYYNAVLWAVENNITNGTSSTTFSPDSDCTRGQIVTFLWRSQGSEKASSANPFVDVAVNAYYTDAVLWAVENEITNGTSATTFSPDANCTRAQIVTFLYRCMAD